MAAEKRPGYHPALYTGAEKKDTLKNQGFYHSSAWRRLRVMALQRDHYLCQACLKEHRFTKATEVHHVRPIEEFPSLALELSNLQSLCWDCHEQTKPRGRRGSPVPERVKIIKITDDSDLDCFGDTD